MGESINLKRFPVYKGPERRRCRRIRRHFIAKFQIISRDTRRGTSADWNMVTMENLSAGGALFNYYKEIEIDSLLNFQINFPPSKTAIKCVGKVIRVKKPSRVIAVRIAAVFVGIGGKERDMINELAETYYVRKAERIEP